MSNPTISDIQIAKDHHATLIATLFQSKQSMKATVVLAPATAIKRQFYQNFAQFLADNGYGVITFDNEYIGESLDGDLAKSTPR